LSDVRPQGSFKEMRVMFLSKTKLIKSRHDIFFFLFLFSLSFTIDLCAQNVGIGVTNPKARLHVADSSVVFSTAGPVSIPAANPPVSGPGGRMMWYAGKAAFRTGYIENNEWDNNNIGPYSFGAGFNTKAIGNTSLALGYQTTALANYSTALGANTSAQAPASLSMGYGTIAKGYSSTVVGFYNDSILLSNDAFLSPTTPLFIVGNGNSDFQRANAMTVLKNGYVGIGKTPANKLDVGYGTVRIEGPEAPGDIALSLGGFGDIKVDAPGIVGGRLTVKENGYVGLGVNNPNARLHVAGDAVLFSGPPFLPSTTTSIDPPVQGLGTRMFWFPPLGAFRSGYVDNSQWNRDSIGQLSFAVGRNTKAKGICSVAMGFGTTASTYYSTAMGVSTIASGTASTAMGSQTTASGAYSTSMGQITNASADNSVAAGYSTNAAGYASTAFGFFTTASGYSSAAMGFGTKAKSSYSLVVGSFNDTTALNSLFEIGNGQSENIRSNVLTVLVNSNVGIGTVSPKTKLHIADGSSGYSGSYFPGATIEGSNNSYLNILTPENNESGVLFGKPSSAASGGIVYNNSSNLNGFQFRTNGNSAKMVIDQSGNVGIGTITPSTRLQVAGNICATGSIGACSDIRYKKDLAPLTNSLASILSLNGIYYHWKKDEFPAMQFNDERQLGFSAQEVEKLFPELVMTDANGYKSVDYGRMTPVLVEAIKEQQQQIELLRNDHQQQDKRINELEQRTNNQEQRIKQLETLVKKLLNQ